MLSLSNPLPSLLNGMTCPQYESKHLLPLSLMAPTSLSPIHVLLDSLESCLSTMKPLLSLGDTSSHSQGGLSGGRVRITEDCPGEASCTLHYIFRILQ